MCVTYSRCNFALKNATCFTQTTHIFTYIEALHDSSKLVHTEFDSWRLKSSQHSIQIHTQNQPAIFSLEDYFSFKARIRFEYLLENMAEQGGVFIYPKVH